MEFASPNGVYKSASVVSHLGLAGSVKSGDK